jgi:hypothetical protein
MYAALYPFPNPPIKFPPANGGLEAEADAERDIKDVFQQLISL